MSFTPPEGKITVFGHFAPSGDVEIAVKDSGAGMTPAEAKRAVTRFGHAEDEFARKHQGIGLGLPLAKSLTELLGGRMRVESLKGEGTIVTLGFPLEVVSAPVAQISPANDMSARLRNLLAH
jgi:two-component system cell cycle sensor histidine kinase PleC